VPYVTPVERLRERLLRRRGEWKEIAAVAGVSYRTVRRIAKGERRDVLLSTVEAVQAALGRR